MKTVREYISLILEQSPDSTRLKKEQIKITCRLVMMKDAHVPDTLGSKRAS